MQAGAPPRCSHASLQRPARPLSGLPALPSSRARRGRRFQSALSALSPDQVEAVTSMGPLLGHLQHMLTLGLEPVVLPCSSMGCGDIVYRSSLDPVLRMEQKGINPQGILLAAVASAYLFVKPGVLPGAIDYYIRMPLQRMVAKAYAKEDFVLGKKLASGGFGTVYVGDLIEPDTKEKRKVVVKKAKEFGEAEVWMNERMMRHAPESVATFITAFSDADGKKVQPGDPLWLVWAYEGDNTLAELLKKPEFPANVEPLLFGRQLNIPPGPERRAAVIRILVQQLLENLLACHNAGIVHRDVKPQNMIMSNGGRVKLIDFGAAADLRIGINYVPNQYLLDMRYAPPQKYIMNKYTPRAPSKPLAALLSPVLWNLFYPDRFDMYSVGITMLQLACPNLRNDNALIAFNKQLSDQYNHDLRKWRADLERKGPKATQEWAEGLAVLDCDDGAAWDLACSLIAFNPQDRLSCNAALRHRWFAPSSLTLTVSSTLSNTAKTVGRMVEVEGDWLSKALTPPAAREWGGLTEVQLDEELADEAEEEEPAPQYTSATMAWWRGRQSYLQQKLGQRRAQIEADLEEFGKQAGKTIKENGKRLSLTDFIKAGKR